MKKKGLVIGGSILWIVIILWIILIVAFSGWSWEKHFNDNWQLESEWNLNEEGQKEWKWIEYYENGEVKEKWKYVNNNKDWTWVFKNENGETIKEVEYENWKQIM